MAEKDRIIPAFIRKYQPDPHDQRSILLLSDKLLEAQMCAGIPGLSQPVALEWIVEWLNPGMR